MKELEEDYHGWVEMALHSVTGPVFWLALAGVAAVVVLLPAPARHSGRAGAAASPASTPCSRTSTTSTGSTSTRWPRVRACSAWACGRAATSAVIDGVLIDGSMRGIGRHRPAGATAAERLPVLVRAGDDRRRDRLDDVAALAGAQAPGDESLRAADGQGKKNNNDRPCHLLSLAIWLPIACGAPAARLRAATTEPAAVRWAALDRARSSASPSRFRWSPASTPAPRRIAVR